MRSLLAYSEPQPKEEKLVLRLKADNEGDIYIPVGGYSVEGTQDCEYNWNIKIDDGEAVNYSGTGSTTAIRVGYGLTPLTVHTVRITPTKEAFGWLRAFGYKGSGKADSLVNIISDKSYKGFAVSNINTGDYYKAYQYYGCTNLINTDDELLPDTLQIIGDNYRAYEYYGCAKLQNNAEEKILKSVKAIGNNFRAHQYEGCTSITKVGIRAINWASVGNGYRDSLFTSAFNNRNKATISIEGGIVEGGDWGLNDGNIKEILVYTGLVTDYQTKLSTITSSKIRAKTEWDNNNYEYIDITALADSSGNIRIPVAGYSTTGTQDCAYDWMISIDNGEATEYSGIGSATYISIGSGLTSGTEYRVVIEPKTVAYGWGRAFGYYNSGAEGYIKELTHDSYKCFASSYTSTGNYYKYRTYYGCTNLLNSYEKLPTSVTTIGDYYMKEAYKSCTGLTTSFYEVLHSSITIGTDYRSSEYYGCTALTTHQGIAGYTGTTFPTNYKVDYLTSAGSSMNVYFTRYEPLASGLTNSLGINNSNLSNLYCYVNDIVKYRQNENWSTYATSTKWQSYYYPYICSDAFDLSATYTQLWEKNMLQKEGTNSSYNVLGVGIGYNEKEDVIYLPGYGGSNSGYSVRAGTLYQKTDDIGVNQPNWHTVYNTYQSSRYYTRTIISKDKHFYHTCYRGDYSRYAYGYILYANFPGIGTTVAETSPNVYEYDDMINDGGGVSKNGQYCWVNVEGTMWQYSSPDAWTFNGGGYTQTDIGGLFFDFSDDGYTMYIAESGAIKQYSLSSPWFVSSRTYTGKSVSVSGNAFVFDSKGNIFTMYVNTVRKYIKS